MLFASKPSCWLSFGRVWLFSSKASMEKGGFGILLSLLVLRKKGVWEYKSVWSEGRLRKSMLSPKSLLSIPMFFVLLHEACLWCLKFTVLHMLFETFPAPIVTTKTA